jgi:hypothetical protein
MGFLDTKDEADESDVTFDDESKIRLFETQQKSSKSIHDYVKKFFPVAIGAIVILLIAGYLMMPGTGDEVRASDDLYNAVYQHKVTHEKRSISEAAFYKCDGFYWVRILAEPKQFPPSNPEDPVNQYRLSVKQDGGSWQVATLPLPTKENDKPCNH